MYTINYKYKHQFVLFSSLVDTKFSKAHALELGRFSTRNNFHSEVLRRNKVFTKVFVLTYVDIE